MISRRQLDAAKKGLFAYYLPEHHRRKRLRNLFAESFPEEGLKSENRQRLLDRVMGLERVDCCGGTYHTPRHEETSFVPIALVRMSFLARETTLIQDQDAEGCFSRFHGVEKGVFYGLMDSDVKVRLVAAELVQALTLSKEEGACFMRQLDQAYQEYQSRKDLPSYPLSHSYDSSDVVRYRLALQDAIRRLQNLPGSGTSLNPDER